jgi:hypothetical protein
MLEEPAQARESMVMQIETEYVSTACCTSVCFALAQTRRVQLSLCVGSHSRLVLGKSQVSRAAFKNAMDTLGNEPRRAN